MTASQMFDAKVVRLIVVLAAVCVVVSAILGSVNAITKDTIAAIDKAKTDAAFAEVLQKDAEDEYLPVEAVWNDKTITGVWEAETGHVVRMKVSGAQSNIDLVVGVDRAGVVTGVSLISHGETPGLGAKADEPSWRDQFKGQTGHVAVSKDGGTIDALTGATITSRAVAGAVNTALETVAALG